MAKHSEIDDVELTGKLDLYEDPETGLDLVAVYPDDGEEYVITNRKMVKKLMKYTEDDVDIKFTGTVREDSYSHIKVLTVENYEPLQELHELTHSTTSLDEDFTNLEIPDDATVLLDEEDQAFGNLDEDENLDDENLDDLELDDNNANPAPNGKDSAEEADFSARNDEEVDDPFEQMMRDEDEAQKQKDEDDADMLADFNADQDSERVKRENADLMAALLNAKPAQTPKTPKAARPAKEPRESKTSKTAKESIPAENAKPAKAPARKKAAPADAEAAPAATAKKTAKKK